MATAPPAPGSAGAPSTHDDEPAKALSVSANVLESDFARVGTDSIVRSSSSLRVTCYGSSSSLTPHAYLQDAYDVGYLLGVRGHVCVNGAGGYGCMAALNDGAAMGDGHIVGVIHEMWLMEGENAASAYGKRNLRDGGAHSVFASSSSSKSFSDPSGDASGSAASNAASRHGGPHPALGDGGAQKRGEGPIREMLVARGKDLQERKRLLVEKSDALVVLPGGPGTWDELWEMACARNIGLTNLPIVCVNTNGYYDSFRRMLERSYEDRLTKLRPEQILHFEDTALGAVRWVEETCAAMGARAGRTDDSAEMASSTSSSRRQRAKAILRSSSVLSAPALSWLATTYRRASSWISDAPPKGSFDEGDNDNDDAFGPSWSFTCIVLRRGVWFGLGLAVGLAWSSNSKRR